MAGSIRITFISYLPGYGQYGFGGSIFGIFIVFFRGYLLMTFLKQRNGQIC